MTTQEIIDTLRNGTEIKWLPRSVSGNGYEPSGGRDLYVGKRLIWSSGEQYSIHCCLMDLEKNGWVKEITQRNGVIRYRLTEKGKGTQSLLREETKP